MLPKYYVLTYVILIFVSCFITTSLDIINRYKIDKTFIEDNIDNKELVINILIPNYLLGIIWPFVAFVGIYDAICYLLNKLIIKPYLKLLKYIATR